VWCKCNTALFLLPNFNNHVLQKESYFSLKRPHKIKIGTMGQMHSPCRNNNPNSLCMKMENVKKNYPKKFRKKLQLTIIDLQFTEVEINNAWFVIKLCVKLDKVVPTNLLLLKHYRKQGFLRRTKPTNVPSKVGFSGHLGISHSYLRHVSFLCPSRPLRF
jgi:hypothetical protein